MRRAIIQLLLFAIGALLVANAMIIYPHRHALVGLIKDTYLCVSAEF